MDRKQERQTVKETIEELEAIPYVKNCIVDPDDNGKIKIELDPAKTLQAMLQERAYIMPQNLADLLNFGSCGIEGKTLHLILYRRGIYMDMGKTERSVEISIEDLEQEFALLSVYNVDAPVYSDDRLNVYYFKFPHGMEDIFRNHVDEFLSKGFAVDIPIAYLPPQYTDFCREVKKGTVHTVDQFALKLGMSREHITDMLWEMASKGFLRMKID